MLSNSFNAPLKTFGSVLNTFQGMEQLESLGRVKYILVPSRFHRLDADVYKKRYPNAQVIWYVKVVAPLVPLET